MRNDLEFLKDTEIIYDSDKLIGKSNLSNYIINGNAFKIKVMQTKDRKNVILNDKMIKELKENNIKLEKVTHDDIIKLKNTTSGAYIDLNTLLSDLKSNAIIYIEILNKSYKHSLEDEIIMMVKQNNIRALVSSAEKQVIKYFKKKMPSIVRGITYKSLDDNEIGYFDKSHAKKVKVYIGTNPDFIDYDINYINDNIKAKILKHNCKVLINLIDTDAKLKKAKYFANTYVVKNNYLDREE